MKITPSLLFNYIQCPHKPWRDIYGPKNEESIESNPFLQLLWEKGVQHEKDVISSFTESFEDLHEGTIEERLIRTRKAMDSGKKFIYQGVIQYANLLGIPDLLTLEDGCYYPIDIKSGAGLDGIDEESGEEGKPKKHYAVQLSLYVDILIKMGFTSQRKGFIIGADKTKVEYNLDAPMAAKNPETYWNFYHNVRKIVSKLIKNETRNSPALSGACKLCNWHESCKNWCTKNDDLTQLFNIGRKVRDTLNNDVDVSTVKGLLSLSIGDLMNQKEGSRGFLTGIGEATLKTAKRRANILTQNSPPVLYSSLNLPEVKYEIYLDLEDDPTQNFTYLHGLYVRTKERKEFKYFVAKEFSDKAEKEAWAKFWAYIKSLPENNYAVYYYSAHEKTTYKKLQRKFPDVVTMAEVESFFTNKNVIDLYQLVSKYTDWPLGSYGIKSIATYLGFKWRDESPSGALSIQWFNEYLKTKHESILNRILDYNEDDCIATMVLKDKLVEMNQQLFSLKI